nr:Omp28-related outer membrane protein [uncultured Psychroserpens sp.]
MKIKNFTKVFLFVAVAALFSCSSSEDNGNVDGGGDGGPTSITITASSLFVDIGTDVVFTVKTNDGTDVTTDASILIDGAAISGNIHNAGQTGEYDVKATYEDLTSSQITVNVLPVITSITVETADATYNIGDRIDYEVIATDTNGLTNTITSAVEFYVDGEESFTGSTVIPGSTGAIEVYATFGEHVSNTKTVMVEDNAATPGAFQSKALIEDYTGTWCGYCPRVSYGIELSQDASDNVVAVAIHNGDAMANNYGSQMESAVNIQGFPTAWINRAQEWTYPEPNNVNQVTNLATGTKSNGLAINTAIKGDNLSFIVSVGFGENVSGAKLVVFLLENGLVYDQVNYTSYYGGGATINGFVHDHVLRHSFTSVLGDAIPAGEATAGNSYRMHMNYTIPSGLAQNNTNTEIVAMLLNSNGEVINVNKASAGAFADFN